MSGILGFMQSDLTAMPVRAVAPTSYSNLMPNLRLPVAEANAISSEELKTAPQIMASGSDAQKKELMAKFEKVIMMGSAGNKTEVAIALKSMRFIPNVRPLIDSNNTLVGFLKTYEDSQKKVEELAKRLENL